LALTAREIAEKLVPPDGELQPAIERIHHWTREGLLEPLGKKNPGRGRVRLYSDDTVISARILTALADFGMGVGLMGPAIAKTALQLGQHVATELADQKSRGIVSFLCIDKGRALGPNPLVRLHEQPDVTLVLANNEKMALSERPPMHPQADSTLSINLTKLLA
jgi:DNA-binding transcriptional MerR regulator